MVPGATESPPQTPCFSAGPGSGAVCACGKRAEDSRPEGPRDPMAESDRFCTKFIALIGNEVVLVLVFFKVRP